MIAMKLPPLGECDFEEVEDDVVTFTHEGSRYALTIPTAGNAYSQLYEWTLARQTPSGWEDVKIAAPDNHNEVFDLWRAWVARIDQIAPDEED